MPTKNNDSTVEHGTVHSTKEIADFTAKQQQIEQFKKAAKAALQLLDLQNQPRAHQIQDHQRRQIYSRRPP